MKILIVDDESFVRNGLKNSINWENFGISAVLLAEDGVQALRLAQMEEPEIILTDVRMQRMDGIELATRLRKMLPTSHLIFMSGYSDKEYLKAAIQLKAVSYVEKPIDMTEIETAIAEAVRLHLEYSSNQDAQTIRSRMEKAQLAVAMTQVNEQNEEAIRRAWSALDLPSGSKLWFSTVLVHLTNVSDCSELPGLTDFLAKLQEIAQRKRIFFLSSTRSERRILMHLYRSSELTREHIAWFTLQLQKFLMNRFQFFIAAGEPVRGISQVGVSYQSAVETLNNSFYDDLNAILLWTEQNDAPAPIDFDACITAFRNAISSGEYLEAQALEVELYENVMRQRQSPTDLVKNTYYQFVSIMEWIATKSCIPFSATQQEESPWQVVTNTRTVYELHTYFSQLMDEYIRLARNEKEENELVFIMKDYIRKNYHRDMLSVREIAEAACLSTAYACTLFKNETGVTINQFISNYRVERAKQLLADPRYKITDIASQLGYSDSNYFGKSFKRLVGLSPSEYREKVAEWSV